MINTTYVLENYKSKRIQDYDKVLIMPVGLLRGAKNRMSKLASLVEYNGANLDISRKKVNI